VSFFFVVGERFDGGGQGVDRGAAREWAMDLKESHQEVHHGAMSSRRWARAALRLMGDGRREQDARMNRDTQSRGNVRNGTKAGDRKPSAGRERASHVIWL